MGYPQEFVGKVYWVEYDQYFTDAKLQSEHVDILLYGLIKESTDLIAVLTCTTEELYDGRFAVLGIY